MYDKVRDVLFLMLGGGLYFAAERILLIPWLAGTSCSFWNRGCGVIGISCGAVCGGVSVGYGWGVIYDTGLG